MAVFPLAKLLQYINQSAQVILVIEQWLLHTLTNSLRGREMNNATEVGMPPEKPPDRILITQIYLFKSGALPRNSTDPVQYVFGRIGTIVDDYNFKAFFLQGYHCMRTNKAQAPGH
jgi:hypothetical protein